MMHGKIKIAAEYYDCSETTVRRMAKRGEIKRWKEGRYFVFELKKHPGFITFDDDDDQVPNEVVTFAKSIIDNPSYKRKMKPAPDKAVATLLTYATFASIVLSTILYF